MFFRPTSRSEIRCGSSAAPAIAKAGATSVEANTRPSPELLASARDIVDEFIAEIIAKEIMISGDIGTRAIEASMNYGKAVGHAANLNFGDCFAYACAKAHRVGLIYKSDDFAKTDMR